MEQLREEIRPALERSLRGESEPLDIEDIKKTDEELSNEKQDAMQANLIDNVAGPAAGGMAPKIAESLGDQVS